MNEISQMREILQKIPGNSAKNWVKFSFKMSEFPNIAWIPLKSCVKFFEEFSEILLKFEWNNLKSFMIFF